jgi:uncharacterized membrane protein YbaN (DUF454 family)
MVKIWLWRLLGIFFIGMAYLGAIIPGMPMTTFVVLAAWAFAKSSPKLSKWLHEHPKFSPYLIRWETKRVYPQRAKYLMAGCMAISYSFLLWRLWHKPFALIGIGAFMLFWLVWAWRFPGSEEEYERRKKAGEKIGWTK